MSTKKLFFSAQIWLVELQLPLLLHWIQFNNRDKILLFLFDFFWKIQFEDSFSFKILNTKSSIVFATKLENRNVEQEVIYALWFYRFDLQFLYWWKVHTVDKYIYSGSSMTTSFISEPFLVALMCYLYYFGVNSC